MNTKTKPFLETTRPAFLFFHFFDNLIVLLCNKLHNKKKKNGGEFGSRLFFISFSHNKSRALGAAFV